MKVCLKSSSCASAAEENMHALYCLPPFLWMSLYPPDFQVFHTPKQAHSEWYAQILMPRMKRMLFPPSPCLSLALPEWECFSDGFLPRGARKSATWRGAWSTERCQRHKTRTHPVTHPHKHLYRYGREHAHTCRHTSRPWRECETAGESWMLFIHQSFL